LPDNPKCRRVGPWDGPGAAESDAANWAHGRPPGADSVGAWHVDADVEGQQWGENGGSAIQDIGEWKHFGGRW